MKINGHNVYAGAYDAIYVKPDDTRPPLNPRPAAEQEKELYNALNAVSVPYHLSGKDCDYASISEEGRRFTVSTETLDLGEPVHMTAIDMGENLNKELFEWNQAMRNEHLGQEDEEFWGNIGNQWLVFSEHLYKNGFFDDMSAEEALEIDHLLQTITGAMDGYNNIRYGQLVSHYTNFNGQFYLSKTSRDQSVHYLFASSDSLHFMLESSTSALEYFGDKYIEDDALRKEFQGLIDIFHSHNAQKLAGHRSMEELMDEFRVRYASTLEAAMRFGGPEAGERFEDSVTLGSVTHTEAEKNDYLSQLSSMFSQLKDGYHDFDKIWRKIEETFTDYASGGSRRQSVRSLALERSGDSLDRMRNMWAELLGVEQAESSLDVKV